MTQVYVYIMTNLLLIKRLSWLWLVPLLAIWFGIFIGNRPYATPDEGRYVEIPREMVASQDYITPRLNGVKYFEKPPLFYWVQSANLKFFGLQEWSMRLGPLLFALLGCLSTFIFARRFFNNDVGKASCLILATSPLYYALSQLIILDMAMTTLITISLFSFLITVHVPPGSQRRLWAWSFYGFSALAVLTKGIMALAISGPVILIWALATGRWKDLWPAYIPSGTILFLAISVPWHVLAALKNSDFAYKYFIVEHFLRYTTSVHMRSKPFYFFIPVLFLGLFPWITLLWSSIKDGLKSDMAREQRGILLFLLIWAGWTISFFTVSNSKLVPYILPAFPPLALIIGIYWSNLQEHNSRNEEQKNMKAHGTTLGMILILFGLTSFITLWLIPQLINHRPHLWFDFTILNGLLVFLGLIALLLVYFQRLKQALLIMPTSAILLVLAVIHFMPELQRPSIKPLAQIIQSMKKPGDIVGSYKSYYQDLPVYTNQIVTVVDIKGELEFGCDSEDCTAWMIDEKQFLNQWFSDSRLFIVAQEQQIIDLARRVPTFHYHTLGKDQHNTLITNK